MSNPSRKGKKGLQHHHPVWEKEERKLDDGFSYYYFYCKECQEVVYPAPELQKLHEYAKTNLFLFVDDWVLLLIYAGHEYIAGITLFQKMLFLIYMEEAPRLKIPTENPGFYGYLYGPYSAEIDAAIDFLIQEEYIRTENVKSSSLEHFYLTEIGKKKAEVLFNKLSKEQQTAITEFRWFWDTKGPKAICKKIYANERYKEFLTNSIILSKLFPGRRLYRRREIAPKVTEMWDMENTDEEVSQEI